MKQVTLYTYPDTKQCSVCKHGMFIKDYANSLRQPTAVCHINSVNNKDGHCINNEDFD